MRPFLFVPILAALAVAQPSGAQTAATAEPRSPVLHVPIPSDLEDDWTLGATGAGELPAAVETRAGLVRSPDARKPPSSGESVYENPNAADGAADHAVYTPDRNTRRPEVSHYDEPFRPATAPFKRLWVYDAVDESYRLYVQKTRQEPLKIDAAIDSAEDRFFADIVINAREGASVRIPSVAPGAHVLRAHLAAGPRDVPFSLLRDGADNWFVAAPPGRARLVMEVSAPREAFGGEFGMPSQNLAWSDLPAPEKLPSNVNTAAKQVAARIGVSRAMSPREVVRKLVAYHRSFVEADDPPREQNNVYLDLALSQKGVCRHRAFSFLVTALHLGLPTRMVLNEAHAWVEIYDGKFWRRVDLGGAGRTVGDPIREGPAYDAPPDPFQWPTGATPGDSLSPPPNAAPSEGGRSGRGGASSGSTGGASGGNSGGSSRDGAPAAAASASASDPARQGVDEKDERPRSSVMLTVGEADTRRGGPLRIRGNVRAGNETCSNVVIDIVLRGTGKSGAQELRVGSLATDERGAYEGALIVPAHVPVGDYDVVAHTAGNTRCGRSL